MTLFNSISNSIYTIQKHFTFNTTPNILQSTQGRVHLNLDKRWLKDVCLHSVVQYKLTVNSVYLWPDSYDYWSLHANSPDHKNTCRLPEVKLSAGLEEVIKLSILWYLCVLMLKGTKNKLNKCVSVWFVHIYRQYQISARKWYYLPSRPCLSGR